MYDAVSPYALLCMSKPKQMPTAVTPYDLYSQAAFYSEHLSQELPSPVSQPKPSDSPAAVSQLSPVRTHYISDIHAKHGKAGKHAVFNQSPLC